MLVLQAMKILEHVSAKKLPVVIYARVVLVWMSAQLVFLGQIDNCRIQMLANVNLIPLMSIKYLEIPSAVLATMHAILVQVLTIPHNQILALLATLIEIIDSSSKQLIHANV